MAETDSSAPPPPYDQVPHPCNYQKPQPVIPADYVIVLNPQFESSLPEVEKYRRFAILLSVISFFCGTVFCSVPALVLALQKPSSKSRLRGVHYNVRTYKIASGLALLAMFFGTIATIIIAYMYYSRHCAMMVSSKQLVLPDGSLMPLGGSKCYLF